MAKHGRKQGDNSCCPVIRVKCKIAGRGVTSLLPAPKSLQDRLKAFKKKEAAEYARLGGLRGLGNAMKRGGYCTVKLGKAKARRMSPVAAGKAVAAAVSAQKKKRCIPHVVRG